MCTVHDGKPELARLPRLRKSQIKGLLGPASLWPEQPENSLLRETLRRSSTSRHRAMPPDATAGRSDGLALRESHASSSRNGTVAPVPACFLRGESHEERSSDGTFTEEHRQYWGCGLRPATSRIPSVMSGRRTTQLARWPTPTETRPKRRRGSLDGNSTHIKHLPLPQSSSASRFTAGALGFLNLSLRGQGPPYSEGGLVLDCCDFIEIAVRAVSWEPRAPGAPGADGRGPPGRARGPLEGLETSRTVVVRNQRQVRPQS